MSKVEKMGIRAIFARIFSLTGKGKKEEKPWTREEWSEAKVSPYAKFMEEKSAVAPSQPIGRATTNALVFLPTGTGEPPKAKSRPRVKDVFLLDNVEAKPLGTVGLYFPEHGAFLIRDPHRGKAGRLIRWEGGLQGVPFFGDWTGSGRETLGFFDSKEGVFHIWLGEEHKQSERSFLYGPAGMNWTPLVGDWDGDGKDGIGLYDPASSGFVLRNDLSSGEPDLFFMYGPPGIGWIPFVGDWDGDGKDGIGVYDPLTGSFLLRNDLSGGNHDVSFRIMAAEPNWVPLVGDWDGDGIDSVGIYDPVNQAFYLCNQGLNSKTDMMFRFGPVGVSGIPFALRWSSVSKP